MTGKLVVMISGSGSNLQAILDATRAGKIDAQVVLVVSNRLSAYGLVRAEQAGIPTLYFPWKPYAEFGREQYDHDLGEKIKSYQPDLIVLAGWMHILSTEFLDMFANQVINLHPALPGQFPGVNAIQRTYEAFLRGEAGQGGCMVHYVIPEVDAGAVILEQPVPIHENDTLDEFEARMHDTEHRVLVTAIRIALDAE